MTVRVYQSSDPGALNLNSVAGSFVNILDACLGPGGGHGGVANADWDIPFTGTNKRAYRSKVGARMYYRIQDDATNTSFASQGQREARLRGFETMSSVDAGTGLFPTTVQLANGLFFRKSHTTDTTYNTPWICIADERTVYFFADPKDYPGYGGIAFGEIYSLKSTTDAYNGIVIGRAIEQVAATPTINSLDERLDDLAGITVVCTGHYMPRSWTEGFQTGLAVGKHGNAAHSAITLCGLMQYKNGPNDAIALSDVHVHEPATNPTLRGRMRGFWHFLHPVAVDLPDRYEWTVGGRTFKVIRPTADALGIFVIEISNTWETN